MKKTTSKIISLLLTLATVIGLAGLMATSTSAAYENTWRNTGNQRTDILGVARTQVGYSTLPPKYNTWFGSIDGGYNYAWCATFVVWCARQAGIDSSIIRGSAGASPRASCLNVPFVSRGQHSPKPGDLAFFKWADLNSEYTWDHVGLVESVDPDGTVHTIEGNSSKKVQRCTYSKNGTNDYNKLSSIVDYGIPNYKTAKPYDVKISADKNILRTGESIAFNFSAKNATGHCLVLLKWNGSSYQRWNPSTAKYESNTFINRGLDTRYTLTPKTTGSYAIYLAACNGAEWADSDWIYFNVTNGITICAWFSVTPTGSKLHNGLIGYKHYLVYELLDSFSGKPVNSVFKDMNFSVELKVIKPGGSSTSTTKNRIDKGSLSATMNDSGSYSGMVNVKSNGKPLVSTEAAITIMPSGVGNINRDGKIDAGDVAMLKKHITGIESIPLFNRIYADLNGDGKIDITDLAILKQYVVA